jgi:hypothetical protein
MWLLIFILFAAVTAWFAWQNRAAELKLARYLFVSGLVCFILSIAPQFIFAYWGPKEGQSGYDLAMAWYNYAPPLLGIAAIILIVVALVMALTRKLRTQG